jgi:hypothetical protein
VCHANLPSPSLPERQTAAGNAVFPRWPDGPTCLEDVTLAAHVELMVEMGINLLGGAVLSQQAAQHPLAAHPKHLHGHAGVRATLALAWPQSKDEAVPPPPRQRTLLATLHATAACPVLGQQVFGIPGPLWRPLRTAAACRRAREREWTTSGLRMIKPSLTSFWTDAPAHTHPRAVLTSEGRGGRIECQEEGGAARGWQADARLLAEEMRVVSLGSSQILRLPHFITLAAKRCRHTGASKRTWEGAH